MPLQLPDVPPRFAVLDIVRIDLDGRPETSDERGTILEIRHYKDRGYRYSVSHDELGGILDEETLAATGDRDVIETFWVPPLRKGDIVTIADTLPNQKWRGSYAVVEHCYDDSDRYGVTITLDEASAKSGGLKTKNCDIAAHHLIATGDQIPPLPVPRAVTTYRSHNGRGVRPTHEFTVIDEIAQYL